MDPMVVDLLYGLVSVFLGAAGAWWLCWRHFSRQGGKQGILKARHATEVLIRLRDLATRVAVDVEEHSSQVEEINDKLTSANGAEPALIVTVVAELIQANQQIHERLTSTENKLREQAEQIQINAVEARTDSLTLLANRRAFDDELDRRVAEFCRHSRPFSLLMADVDRFKKVNDMHGHQAGDEVLRGVARLLRRKMREMDLVARYGGEEFAIILPETNLEDACKAAVRTCEAIEKAHFRHEGRELRVTASFGVAAAAGSSDGAALLTRADAALYSAKEGGRNCVYRHDGDAACRVVVDKQPARPAPLDQGQGGPVPGEQEKGAQPNAASDAKATEAGPDLARALDLGMLLNLPGRTAFCQQVRNRMAELKRGGPTFSIVLIEVNQYDEGDDERGRRAREVAALAASEFLVTTIRETQVVGRYGPGCFAMLLPRVGLADAIRLAERLRRGFSQCSPLAQGEQPRLTLSVGVVQVMESDDSISVLTRAEAALDAADRRGGDRAYCHDGERCAPVTAMLEAMDYLT